MLRWVIFLLSFVLIGRFCVKQTDGLTIEGLRSNRPYNPAFEGRLLTMGEREEAGRALALKYRYYGRGGQSFIFFSEGEEWVLKLFRQEVFSTPVYFHFISPFFSRYKEKKRWKKEDKLRRDFTSYTYAQNELQDLTGVLMVHLNRTDHLKKHIVLVDRLGIGHTLNLDEFDFVLQRKAAFVYDRINEAMRAHDIDLAKRRITALVDLVKERQGRGFIDRDPAIRTNCGFIGEKAVKIDVGRFEKSETIDVGKEFKRIMAPFEKWIESEHPSLGEHVRAEVRRCTG